VVTAHTEAEEPTRTRKAGMPAWVPRAALVLILPQIVFGLGYLVTLEDGVGSQIVDLNAEANLPSWWAATLLLAVAAVAAALAGLERAVGRRSWHWAALSLGFVFLSIEEIAGIHERVGDRLDAAGSGAGAKSDWVFLYLPILVAGAAVLVMVVRDLPARRALMVGAGLALFASVVAIELLELLTDSSVAETLYEENAELLGHIVILLALVWQLTDKLRASGVRLPQQPR